MDDKDNINRLRKRLYSRNGNTYNQRRHGLRPNRSSGEKEWLNQGNKKIVRKKNKRSLLWLFLVIAILFFIGSIIFGSFYLFSGKNVVSSNNVDIQIQGPTAIGGGKKLGLQISIVNKNSSTLELADLIVKYPKGTRSPDNLGKGLLRFRDSLGDILPGERVKRNVSAILFGEENTQKEITVTVEYRVAGSNAIFFAEKKYKLTISSSPVNISVRSFSEVISGQKIDFSIVVSSNSSTNVKNLVLKARYPFGFSFIKSSIKPEFSDSIWKIGDLRPEEEKTIHIIGTMTGQDNEERTFSFAVGVRDKFDVKKLATTFVASTRGITIERPFISTDLTLNDKREDSYVFNSGERIQGEIAWKNNLTKSVSDAQIEVHLSGVAVDESSILVERGFYNSVTNTIRWSKDTLPNFTTLSPSQAGIVKFSFKTKNISALGLKNPEVTVDVTVRGKRENENNVPEQIKSVLTRDIRIISDLSLVPRILYNTGPLSNSGPMPPVIEKKTKYTVVWTVTNTANNISGVKVVGVLPSYVRWTGNFSPNNSDIQFNPNNNQVTWNVGEVSQGVGSSLSPKEVSFQIGFTPSLSQIGETPILVHTQTISGFDQFTEVQIDNKVLPLNIQIKSETGLPSGYDKVSK